MNQLPRISVVTPTFNSINTLLETIESVSTQKYPNLEHIVIDGGSTDGTVDLLKKHPHLRWHSEKDEGHYDAMNKGIRIATGEIVNILNADDCYRPGVLDKVGRAFAENPDWDGLFGDIVYVDGKGDEIYRREEALFDYDVLRFSRICYVIHQTLFVKKTVHDQLGLYRNREFLNSCDYAFILSMGRAGCRVGHLPEYLIDYRYHQFGQSADLRVTRNMAREAEIILKEHSVPSGVSGRVLRAIYRGKRQFQKLCYRGKCDLVSGTWILRKHMQQKTDFTSNIPIDKL